ncbi:protein regulator of cytokinesis 1-like isoform X2 [Arctopsyche grandis]|uniref:protein regulator of cytokinesis 1-like isoform X2 n=1 Tax=Arctopsyche grandis TaxID=121162 RepID=UPI00406D9F47
MLTPSEEASLFQRVERTIAENARAMIYDLNEKWKLLGVEGNTRHIRTENLIAFVQERYDELVEETNEKIKKISADIQTIQAELTELSLCLNLNINTTHMSDHNLETKKEALEKELVKFQSILKQRTDTIRKLNEWQDRLCHFLNCKKRILPDRPLPTEGEVLQFEEYLIEQEQERQKRIQIFRKKQNEILDLLGKLEQEPFDSFQRSVLDSSGDDFILSDSNMALLAIFSDNLEDNLEQKKAEVLELRERLVLLWERLEEPQNYRDDFLNQHPGYSRATEAALLAEIERCEEMKRQSFQKFIIKLREEILEIWDKCLYSDLQKEKFVDFYREQYDEDILTSHEIYLDDLKKFYENNKSIFDKYSTRQHLWFKWKELEEKAKDSGRFHNRGGQLLIEERERKAVSNQLPKIEAELEVMARDFEARCGIPFTVRGHNLIQTMHEDWNKKNEQRQTQLSARKNKATFSTPMSAPRSAPVTRRLQPGISRDTLTAVKRRLSPNPSPQPAKSQVSVRRLQFTPSSPAASPSSNRAKRKRTLPSIALNGYLLKKKVVGRLSQEKKGTKRSRRSNSRTPNKSSTSQSPNISTYSNFQEHIDENAEYRSSTVPGHNLRPRSVKAEPSKFKPDGKAALKNDMKENMSPNYLGFLTPNNNKHSYNANTPVRNLKTDIDVFATPARPVGKFLLSRQNSISVISPSVMNGPRQLRRSNSSHTLRSNIAG